MASNDLIKLPRGTQVPDHIGVVLDGNGRWARARGLPNIEGHAAGYQAVKRLIEASRDLGVHTITLWGFSTENWSRPEREVKKIMNLVKKGLTEVSREAIKEGTRVVHLGRKDRLPKDIADLIAKIETESAGNKKYILNIALDYGGRDEILRATKKIVEAGVPADKINEELFASYLDTANQPYPYPDLFIRTSGEQRTSGFLPWQMTYTEFYWEQDHLPDMTPEKLKAAILDYSRRRRRFGAYDKKVEHLSFKPELVAKFELAWWRLEKIPEGERFRDYARKHVSEQFGLSKALAKDAANYMVDALLHGEDSKWTKAKTSFKKFYELVRDEVKLAFEPSIVASLEVKLLQEIADKNTAEQSIAAEATARQFYAEVYRISLLQAAKLAHLRVLASIERNLAESGMGEHHWDRAEDYLQKFYKELKGKVA